MTWPDACWFAVDRSKSDLGLLTRIISALGGVLVRSSVTRPLPASASLTLPSPPSPQIAAFLATGACSGYMFYRWFRLDSAARAAVWSLYGRFTAMVFVGCCCGALSCTPFLPFPFLSFLFLPHRFVLSSSNNLMRLLCHPSILFPIIKTVTTCQGPLACKT